MFLGANPNDTRLRYVDYEVPDSFAARTVSSVLQRRFINKLRGDLVPTRYPVGVLGIHSTPTDHSAMQIGGALFEQAIYRGLIARCLTLSDIATNRYQIDEADIYLIHTLSDQIPPAYAWSLRDFLRSRSMSLRIITMTSATPGDGFAMQTNILRMRDMAAIVCLSDAEGASNLRLT